MPNTYLSIIGLLVFTFLSVNQGLAVNTTPANKALAVEKLNSDNAKQTRKMRVLELRKQKKSAKIAKKVKKIQSKISSKGVDFKDPVNKWKWFWLFGWGAFIVLIILAGVVGTASFSGFEVIFNSLGLLSFLFGTASLVIWLIKK